MQNDLISRSALIEAFWDDIASGNQLRYEDTEELMKNAPAVDAVEVVRCKDCKHYMTIHCTCDGCCISDYWYCADGERRADDGK